MILKNLVSIKCNAYTFFSPCILSYAKQIGMLDCVHRRTRQIWGYLTAATGFFGFKSLIFQPLWPRNFDGWPRKIIGHFFYTTPSFAHHFKTMNSNWSHSHEMLNSGKQIGDFLSRVTLKFDRWLWKIIGHILYKKLLYCICSNL